ncbi:MAG: hypothetical protein HON94_00840 [Methylococcales bacterium]|jgi:hypothetical protein|nr:hypothetical protein [Methylococcales bacterium]
MPILLFKLRNVPEDEANDVRQILDDENIDYYESDAGKWGVSVAAIWLKNKEQRRHCKALIDQYQTERYRIKHAEYEQLKRNGKHKKLLDSFVQHPVRFVVYMSVSLFLIYLTLMPFLNF